MPGAVVGSIVWPVILFVAIEILVRVAWPLGRQWAVLRFGGMIPVALVAGVVSYRHLSSLLTYYGEDRLVSALGPRHRRPHDHGHRGSAGHRPPHLHARPGRQPDTRARPGRPSPSPGRPRAVPDVPSRPGRTLPARPRRPCKPPWPSRPSWWPEDRSWPASPAVVATGGSPGRHRGVTVLHRRPVPTGRAPAAAGRPAHRARRTAHRASPTCGRPLPALSAGGPAGQQRHHRA
ncbi:hypothetical protein ACFQZ4_53440 [Catellatospora coxensis]